jgi:hypothetical protein
VRNGFSDDSCEPKFGSQEELCDGESHRAAACEDATPEPEPRMKLPNDSSSLITHVNNKLPGNAVAPADPRDPPVSQPTHPATQNEPHDVPETLRRAGNHVLYQEVFFFCTVPNVGDVPGTGCIYVETVVDQNFGYAFAKVYAAKNAMHSADVLFTRVFPFFAREEFAIRSIYTPRKPEYFGLAPVHPFETLLATSHIQHLSTDRPGAPHSYVCLQFYRFLQRKFFQPALRRKFSLSLDELQNELDAFIDAYNSLRLRSHGLEKHPASAPSKFPFDL